MVEEVKKERRRKVKLGSILVYVDEPQLLVLDTAASAKIIAVAIDYDQLTMPFLGAEISETQWVRYLREQVDLRYLFQYPRYKRWYVFDYSVLSKENTLLAPTIIGAEQEENFFPDAGFFSRHHTEDAHGKSTTSTQEFDVDGAWDLNEFSQFYSRMADIYAFEGAAKNWHDANVSMDVKRKTKLAFLHNWRGGSSYVNFFDELYEAQPYSEQIAVHSIQYASPGTIKVDGNVAVFNALKAALADFAQVKDEVRTLYDSLRKFLSESGFLRLQGAKMNVDSKDQDRILKESRKIAEVMKFTHFDFIYEMSDKNALVAAKVMLALVRRIDALFVFFAEGRVKLPSEEIRA